MRKSLALRLLRDFYADIGATFDADDVSDLGD